MKYYYLALLILFCLLQACSKEETSSSQHLLTIKQETTANNLFYTGIVRPLHTVVIPSPADGAVVDRPFQYGDTVKQGQLLFQLASTKFLSDYKTALMQYIKAKSEFNTSEAQLSEGKFLHQNQLISDDDFKAKQANYYGAQLALLQAKDALKNLLSNLNINLNNIKDLNPYNLTIADVDKINQALHLQTGSENLRVISPANGIVLSPNKNEEEVKKTMKGDVVKQGDVLAMIGDMSGLSVHIKVNELTVNQLHVGQKVKVSGVAFPEEILQGEIKEVDRQGEPASSGLPLFSVEVMVPALSLHQRERIHVGMSAKVEINLDESRQIQIPINALTEKNGEFYVKRYEGAIKKAKLIAVKTGRTTPNTVAILSGLKEGDRIVLPDSA